MIPIYSYQFSLEYVPIFAKCFELSKELGSLVTQHFTEMTNELTSKIENLNNWHNEKIQSISNQNPLNNRINGEQSQHLSNDIILSLITTQDLYLRQYRSKLLSYLNNCVSNYIFLQQEWANACDQRNIFNIFYVVYPNQICIVHSTKAFQQDLIEQGYDAILEQSIALFGHTLKIVCPIAIKLANDPCNEIVDSFFNH